MIAGAIAFALIVFFLTVYAVNAIRDGIAMWRDLEALDRMMYRVGRVTYLKPQSYEFGVEFNEDIDHFPQQKAMGARESLVRSLEVGKNYFLSAWTAGTSASRRGRLAHRGQLSSRTSSSPGSTTAPDPCREKDARL